MKEVEACYLQAFQSAGLGLDKNNMRITRCPDLSMGHYGVACQPFVRRVGISPFNLAKKVAGLLNLDSVITEAKAVGPYVNCYVDIHRLLNAIVKDFTTGFTSVSVDTPNRIVVEFLGPNTNKPLHLGHVRNSILGDSICRILHAIGHDVHAVNIVNDRGIHICKSMLAYEKWWHGETPATKGEKGDHFVGRCYSRFGEEQERSYRAYLKNASDNSVLTRKEFEVKSPLAQEASDMLRKWENGDTRVKKLWRKMTDWVLDGFSKTCQRYGINFEKTYFESDTYEYGRELVLSGLTQGVFEKDPDGKVICKFGANDRDRKILLRSDGTTLYITQDIGTAFKRLDDYSPDRLIYVVGSEQDYYFKVLFSILECLKPGFRKKCSHLSYGMVELPEGKMKSREGTVVEADDLLDLLHSLAENEIASRDSSITKEELNYRAEAIAISAIKFKLLYVSPRTRIKFNPQESVRIDGETGPYCLYAYTRGRAILRAADEFGSEKVNIDHRPSEMESELILRLAEFQESVLVAAANMDPSSVAQAVLDISRSFNALYSDNEHHILRSLGNTRSFRLDLVRTTCEVLRVGLELLGIRVLEEM